MNKKIEKKVEPKSVKNSSDKKDKTVEKVSTFKKKKKVKRNITSGIAFVYSTFNNTIIFIIIAFCLNSFTPPVIFYIKFF